MFFVSILIQAAGSRAPLGAVTVIQNEHRIPFKSGLEIKSLLISFLNQNANIGRYFEVSDRRNKKLAESCETNRNQEFKYVQACSTFC